MKKVVEIPDGHILVKNEKGDGYNIVKEKFDYHSIKTFEDACEKLGEEHPFVRVYNDMMSTDALNDEALHSQDLVAYMKLRIIVAAMNDGWTPTFAEGERRYFPYYALYTKEELDDFDEEDRKELLFRVVRRSGNGSDADGGVAYASAGNVSSSTSASSGSRLAFKTYEMAFYAAKQFFNEYAALIGLQIIDGNGKE
jgi:hypothetical protein